jgi:hypothetical protein
MGTTQSMRYRDHTKITHISADTGFRTSVDRDLFIHLSESTMLLLEPVTFFEIPYRVDDKAIDQDGTVDGRKLEGETKVLGEDLSQCHFVHDKSHMAWPGLESNLVQRGGNPTTFRARFKGHTRELRTKKPKSRYDQHIVETQHTYDATSIDEAMESLHIQK